MNHSHLGTATVSADRQRDVLRVVQDVLAALLTRGEGPAAHEFTPESHLMDFGASSIQMLQIHAHLEAALKRQIPKAALFEHPTIGELVDYLAGLP